MKCMEKALQEIFELRLPYRSRSRSNLVLRVVRLVQHLLKMWDMTVHEFLLLLLSVSLVLRLDSERLLFLFSIYRKDFFL